MQFSFCPVRAWRSYSPIHTREFFTFSLEKNIDYGLRLVMPFALFSGDQEGGYLLRVIVSSKIRRVGRRGPRGSSGEGRGDKRGRPGVIREGEGRKTLPAVVPGLGAAGLSAFFLSSRRSGWVDLSGGVELDNAAGLPVPFPPASWPGPFPRTPTLR